MNLKSLAIVVLALSLSACKANQKPLDDYIADIERQADRDVGALTPSVTLNVRSYQAHQMREPFVLPQEAIVSTQSQHNKDCWQPAKTEKAGELERYPLAKLRLKGVMSRNDKVSALVQIPSGKLIKVNAGQFIGVNNGKVTKVTAEYLEIDAPLPDGLGCWNQRSVKLALK
ncbi:pilus assembly protein PilP [Vibrio hepatarius]|uniref:pilus assembly protein PilP n=1 Tax=Vibrio hepatarius TaxID=171383 RepID=UPI0037368AD9